VWRNVVPTFIYRALTGQPLLVHGSGASTRDFVYVDDIVEGLLRCAATEGAAGDVFNLASGVEVTIESLAEQINQLAGSTAGIERTPQREWDRSICRVGDPTKSRARLGFDARVPLAEGLARTVEWTISNRARIDACMLRHRHHLDPSLARA
jgi:nucleoside-diphosphate-sugar epimerase